MNTVFHIGDTVKVKRTIELAPPITIGIKGVVVGIYQKLSGSTDICVTFPSVGRDFHWWICTPEELESVQEGSHENT